MSSTSHSITLTKQVVDLSKIPEWIEDGIYLRCPYCNSRNYPKQQVETCNVCGNEARL